MPEAIHYDASDRSPLGDGDLEGWHEILFDGADAGILVVVLREYTGPLRLDFAGDRQRSLLLLEGKSIRLEENPEAPPIALRSLELCTLSSPALSPAEARIAGLITGPATLLEFQSDPRSCRLEVDAVRLGSRTMRETLRFGCAYLYAHAGGLSARVTGEEEPFELLAGECLWLHGMQAGEELEVRGNDRRSVVVLVQVESTPGSPLGAP